MQVVKIKNDIHIGIRPYFHADEPFVMRATMMNFIKSSDVAAWPPGAVDDHRKRIIEPLVIALRPVIACHHEDDSIMLGFILYQAPDILHAIYVKERFRQIGIANALMERAFGAHRELPIALTHLSGKLETNKALRSSFFGKYGIYVDPYQAAVR